MTEPLIVFFDTFTHDEQAQVNVSFHLDDLLRRMRTAYVLKVEFSCSKFVFFPSDQLLRVIFLMNLS